MNVRGPRWATARDATAELARRELARRDLLRAIQWRRADYVRTKWAMTLADELRKVSDDAAAGRSPWLIIEAPPQHGKTEIVGRHLGPWHMGRHPGASVLYATSQQGRADDVSRDARRAASDFARLWPHMGPGEVQNVQAWDTAGGNRWRAVGVGVATAGITAGLAVVDDPFPHRADADSAVYRDRVWDWFRADVITRTTRTGGGIVVMHTRWHEDDLVGRLRREYGDRWRVLSWPAIDADGLPLAPEIVPLDRLEDIRRAVGERDWSALYMQAPRVEGGSLIRREWFDREGLRYTEPPDVVARGAAEVVIGIDTASKPGAGHDWTVAHAWCRSGGTYSLLDEQRGRWEITEQIPRVRAMLARWKPSAVLIEDTSNGTALIQHMRREAGNIIAVSPAGRGKAERAQALAVALEAGSVRLPVGAWADAVVDEWVAFGAGAAHDDRVDASAMVIERWAGKRLAVVRRNGIAGLL